MLCSKCGCEMLAETVKDPKSGEVIGRAETCINRHCSEYLKPVGKEKSDLKEKGSHEEAPAKDDETAKDA